MPRRHASTNPILLGRHGSPGRPEGRGTSLEPRATSDPRRVPTKFRTSDVKVRAVECLCADVNDRDPACSQVAACRRAGCSRRGHPTTFCLQSRGPVTCRSGLPSCEGVTARAGGRTSWASLAKVRSPGPPATGLDVSTTPSQPGRSSALPYCPHSIPRSGPRLHVFSSLAGTGLASLQVRTGTRRGGNVESHHSASTRQQQTYRRSTAWPRAGLRGRLLPRHGLGSGTKRRSRGDIGATVKNRPNERSERPRTRAPHGGGALGANGDRGELRRRSGPERRRGP
jgi:hypothetical protein